ncbi:hypothetical protein DAPPUDRAFT_241193 [Daphnia pulex]|uniref:Uncharacterized protein n=1 Tax=Daphnia pulex TaxID=6669 RepID=E9GDN2_DAPPU|nr:hypothetical protein DAPPUDRAFT_241193 [Daphnia pulex]|eukprot:EFX82109.1 hypothetical protein DAPPUDRAFT_241193 [Daphnia pulex]
MLQNSMLQFAFVLVLLCVLSSHSAMACDCNYHSGGCSISSPLHRIMPANAPTKDFTLAVGAKQAAGIPHRLTAKIPIPLFNPVSLVAAIAAIAVGRQIPEVQHQLAVIVRNSNDEKARRCDKEQECGNMYNIIRMVTTTTTYTSTTTTGTVCFKITSKPGDPPVTLCRKRRQFWIEDPIFFSAPEEQQLLAQFHIRPTEILQVKPTAVPGFKSSFQQPESDDNYDSGSQSLESSFYLPESDLDYDHRVYYPPPPPLFLRRVWNYVSDDMYRWFGSLGTSTTRRTKSTVTFTRIKTLTENEVTTKTNTIAISGCTPSPLPFDVCV